MLTSPLLDLDHDPFAIPSAGFPAAPQSSDADFAAGE